MATLHILATGKLSRGRAELRVAPRGPAQPDAELAAILAEQGSKPQLGNEVDDASMIVYLGGFGTHYPQLDAEQAVS